MGRNRVAPLWIWYRRMLHFAWGICLSIGAHTAHADWIQTTGIGQKTSYLGGAVTAIADDYDAFYANPAGAANFDSAFVGAGAKLVDTRGVKLKDTSGDHPVNKTIRESELAVIPGFGAYYPLMDGLTVGLGFAAPFAIAGDWDDSAGIHRFNSVDQSLVVSELWLQQWVTR